MPRSSNGTNPISMRGSSVRCQDWRDTQIWRETPHPTATEYVPDAVAAERFVPFFAARAGRFAEPSRLEFSDEFMN